MNHFYVDASALAKRYVPENGTALVNYLYAQASPNRLIVFNLGVAEVVSILVRKKNAGLFSTAEFVQALTNLGSEVAYSKTLRKMVADNHTVTTALTFIERHSINATDAVILRSAMDLAAQLHLGGDDLVLVASDQRLLRAAQAEGVTTFDPEIQPQAELDVLLAP